MNSEWHENVLGNSWEFQTNLSQIYLWWTTGILTHVTLIKFELIITTLIYLNQNVAFWFKFPMQKMTKKFWESLKLPFYALDLKKLLKKW